MLKSEDVQVLDWLLSPNLRALVQIKMGAMQNVIPVAAKKSTKSEDWCHFGLQQEDSKAVSDEKDKPVCRLFIDS